MAGSVLITGANGTLATPAVDYLLGKYPEYALILAVRDVSDGDRNTQKLREIIAGYPGAKASIHEVNLADLNSVHKFASTVSDDITAKRTLPLKAILCNACYWTLIGDSELTSDGYDRTLQINHISHVALVLRLLDSFALDGGRIVLFSSEAHSPGRAMLEKIPPSIPEDLDLLIKPGPQADKAAAGFQRYGNSKLVITAWTHALNRYLEKASNSRCMFIAIQSLTYSTGPISQQGHCGRL